MKLAIVGSREFTDYQFLEDSILEWAIEPIELIISGGARGADSLAEQFAAKWNIPTQIFIPDWDRFGRAAGMIRNKDIIENADCVIAFWNGTSKGTANSIQYAKTLGMGLYIVPV